MADANNRNPVSPRSRAVIAAAIGAALASFGFMFFGPLSATNASMSASVNGGSGVIPLHSAPPHDENVVLASPGRIEAVTDVLEIGASVDGIVKSIHVKEGQEVHKGQLLAELDCRELQSTLPLAKSEAESLRHVRARLLKGSRQEERDAAAQRTAKAKTRRSHAASHLQRQRQLAEAMTISRAALEDAERDAGVAESEYQLALRDEALVNADPTAEDRAKADADLNAAERRIALAEEKLAKCSIVAPINGTVLRIMLHESESFALVAPRPILTVADISGRRIRAEVDERDVARIHPGQIVSVHSDAYNGKTFTGKVTRIASVMGRKTVITGDPADKTDRDVLEVIAELEPASTALPVGLRATVKFQK